MWEAFKDWIFWCIESLYNVVGDWGLAIIIITVIFRLIITPLMYKQAKSTYMTQKLQPALNRVKEVFADDPVRQNEETQKLYAEAKFNPLAGCVPMLIQLPIFIALFQVLREMGERVGTDSGAYSFLNLVPNLVLTPSQAFSQGMSVFIPYLVLLLIFAFATFVPTLLMMKNQEGQQKTMTMGMMIMMTIMMLFVGWSSPGGVLLFWGASSILAIIQQQGSMAIIKSKDKGDDATEIDFDNKPVVVNVTRKEKKKRPKKKR